MWGGTVLKDRPVAYRDVSYGGASSIRVAKTVYVDQLQDEDGDLGEYVATVKQVVARLAEVLGLVLEHETVKTVVREVVKKVYVRRARKHIAHLEQQARAYVRTPAGKGKRRGRSQRTVGQRLVAPVVRESWNPDEFFTGGASDGGKTHEEW